MSTSSSFQTASGIAIDVQKGRAIISLLGSTGRLPALTTEELVDLRQACDYHLNREMRDPNAPRTVTLTLTADEACALNALSGGARKRWPSSLKRKAAIAAEKALGLTR